jgi:ElaB/YqjD/DUF883 family membrane-anchored ribosome-binding protein
MSRARNHHSQSSRAVARRNLSLASSTNQQLNSDPIMSTATSQKTDTQTSDDLKALLHEAEQALSNTAGEAGEKFDDLRERLRDALETSKYSFEHLRTEATRRAKQADQMVRDNPYYAIGIAAGVGALVGILVSRSLSNSR